MSGVNVSEGSSNSVGGKAGVISLWSSVGIIASSTLVKIFVVMLGLLVWAVRLSGHSTHHFPIKVGCRVIGELAQTRVKGAVT